MSGIPFRKDKIYHAVAGAFFRVFIPGLADQTRNNSSSHRLHLTKLLKVVFYNITAH
jgi:hypothetical protein